MDEEYGVYYGNMDMLNAYSTIDGSLFRVRPDDDEMIKRYDNKSYEIKFVKSGHYKKMEENLFIGFEVEFELPKKYGNVKQNEIAKYIKDNFGDFIAECKHDGSLINGFEAVSHPTHIGLIFTKKFKKRLETFFNYLKSIGAKMCQTTGLHFHISNDYLRQDRDCDYLRIIQAKIIVECNNMFKILEELSHRYEAPTYADISDGYDCNGDRVLEKSDLFSYCKFPIIDENYNTTNAFSVKYYSTNPPCSHRTAINCGNSTTTEFRFFAGTLDYNEFIEDVSLVVGLCRMAIHGTMSIDILNNMMPVKIDKLTKVKDFEFILTDGFTSQEKVNRVIQFLKPYCDAEKEKFDMLCEYVTKFEDLTLASDIYRDFTYMMSAIANMKREGYRLAGVLVQDRFTLNNLIYSNSEFEYSKNDAKLVDKLYDKFLNGGRYKWDE
jgi:hypothetical protein